MIRLVATLAVLAAMSFGAEGRAAEVPASSKTIWAARPTRAQIVQGVPAGGGRAVLRCHVETTGALSGCVTVAESPAASGFGAAIAAMASLYRLKPEAVASESQDRAFTFSVDTFVQDSPPAWARRPKASELMAVWPRAAMRAGVGGSAVVSCLNSTQGALFDCVVLRESPTQMGFGAAAVALTPQLLFTPAKLSGEPVLSVVNIPIDFKSDGRIYSPKFTPAVVSAAMAWPEAPSFVEVAAVYPKAAREARIAGRATLLCGFDIFGHLDSCRTIAEEPKGQGFGTAAHLLTRRFLADRTTPTGRPIGQAELQIPFVFNPAMLGDRGLAVGMPVWISRPTPAQTQAAFADLMKVANGPVRVTLECTVQQGGGLSNCAVAADDPAGKGGGPAALTLASRFMVATWTLEGLPIVGGRISVTVQP